MTGVESSAPELLVDNQSTIALSKNPVFHEWSKHTGVQCHEDARTIGGHIDKGVGSSLFPGVVKQDPRHASDRS
jgi:hypothetical protein